MGIDMNEPIIWHTKKIKLGDLKDYQHNPRRISKKDFERLVNDIKQDGYHGRILVNYDNTIIGGHSRRKALIAAGYRESEEIEVLSANRLLTDSEFHRLNIRDNLQFGEWDFESLANNFDTAELIEWGFPEILLPQTQFDMVEEEKPKKQFLSGNICATCPYKNELNVQI